MRQEARSGQRQGNGEGSSRLIWVDDICLALKIRRGFCLFSSVRSLSSTWTITTPSRYAQTHPHPPLAHSPRPKGLAQVTASIHTIRGRVAAPTDRARSPRLYIRAHFLLFNVRKPIFNLSGCLYIVSTAFQKTVSLFGKAQSRHSRASSAVSVWLPFSVVLG